ncbi:MAG: DUF4340 domain-containing protein [Planctomycetota bacterium]|jgi:hypothetical protein
MTRRNLILLLAAAVAWSVYLGLTRPWQGDAHARTSAQVGRLYPQLAEELDRITKVVLSNGDVRTTLLLVGAEGERRGRGWMVEEKGFPVDFARFTQMLDNLSSITTSDVVSVNRDKHEVYGVAEGQGTRVKVFGADNRLLVDWIAGSLRQQDIAGGQKPVLEFYMRDARSDRVYLSGDALQPAVDPARWCEVHLLKDIAMERVAWVQRLDFQTGESWRIERRQQESADIEGTSSAWYLTEPESDQGVVLAYAGDSMATSIVGIEVADVVGESSQDGTDEARYGFPQDRFTVGIEGNEFLFELGKPAPGGQRYLRVQGLPYIFTLTDFEVSQLRQPVERMLAAAEGE